MWAGVQVPGSQDGGDVCAEGHPQPEAISQAGPGGNQDPRASAQPGHPLYILDLSFALHALRCSGGLLPIPAGFSFVMLL